MKSDSCTKSTSTSSESLFVDDNVDNAEDYECLNPTLDPDILEDGDVGSHRHAVVGSPADQLPMYSDSITIVKTESGVEDASALMSGDALSLPLFGDEEQNEEVDGCLAGTLPSSVTVTGIMSFLPPPETAFEHMESVETPLN